MSLPATIFILGLTFIGARGQRTPTITYISPPIVTRIGGTIEMDCSAIYATEYPILWVKLPSGCTIERETLANNIRSIVSDSCTPIPLSSGSALIIRDNRFRFEAFAFLFFDVPYFCSLLNHLPQEQTVALNEVIAT